MNRKNNGKYQRHRAGSIAVLSAFLMIVLLGMVAFSVDVGYILVAKTELQRSADAAATAAIWELIDEDAMLGSPDLTDDIISARNMANGYTGANRTIGQTGTMVLDVNSANAPNGDVVIGYISNLYDPNAPFDFSDPNESNAVQVRVRREAGLNGAVPFFFGKIFNHFNIGLMAEATAALETQFGGFTSPSDGSNLGILPFALDDETWEELKQGSNGDPQIVSDEWRRYWDQDAEEWIIESGPDGIYEVNLYPQGTGSPGNRGTVDIGSSNNSTNDISRQITDGISPADLDYHGGSLEFDGNGEMPLNGDTGISAGVKDELASIVGQPKIIPIFEKVEGPGNNATYTIVDLVGVTVLDVKLTGSMSSKRVIIQPAKMVTKGGIPSPGGPRQTYYIYSPGKLIR